MGAEASAKVIPIDPPQITIRGSQPLVRTFHGDERGFLIETLRADDRPVNGERFQMSYSSLTLPGHFRDADRWHLHRIQTDRFVVVLGEMMLALYDGRDDSATRGTLEVVRMVGAAPSGAARSRAEGSATYLVPIPPGVLHGIGNLSREPFLLQNFPTELYNPADEGRVPFSNVVVAALGGPFGWHQVNRTSRSP